MKNNNTTTNNAAGQMHPLRAQIGRELANWRTFRGLTQCELARRSGLTQANVSNIERGKYNVSVDLLERITAVLECGVSLTSRRG